MCNCESPDSNESWFNNKEMYSKKFLNQEILVDKELLDDEDRRYLTNMYNLINVRNCEIYTICKCVDSVLGKKLALLVLHLSLMLKIMDVKDFADLYLIQKKDF